jgi:putative flippase GtrA
MRSSCAIDDGGSVASSLPVHCRRLAGSIAGSSAPGVWDTLRGSFPPARGARRLHPIEVPSVARSGRSQPLLDRTFRFARFGMVGASGVVVNQSLLMALHGGLGWPLLPSSLIAIETAIISNFVLSAIWIWRYDFGGSFRRIGHKFGQYQLATLFSSLIVNASVLHALVYLFGVDYRIANLGGIAAGMLLNFLAGELWVFRPPSSGDEIAQESSDGAPGA